VFWVTCGVKMMSLRHHGWGCHPIQTASHIHIRHVHSVWAQWYTAHRHMLAALLSYTHHMPYVAQILVIWVSCRVKMMSLPHVWGCPFIQTASHIHIIQMQNVWAHWYAVHRHTVAALLRYTHPTWLRFGWSAHLWSQNDVLTSNLRLPFYSNCISYPY
jgi:hypothetical protein